MPAMRLNTSMFMLEGSLQPPVSPPITAAPVQCFCQELVWPVPYLITCVDGDTIPGVQVD